MTAVEECFKNVVAKRFLIDLGYKEGDVNQAKYNDWYNKFKEEDSEKISKAFKNQQDLPDDDIKLIIKMYKAVTIDMVRVENKLCDSPVGQYLTLEELKNYFDFKPEEIGKLKQLFPGNKTDDELMLKLREFCKNNFLKSVELERELKAQEHCISRKEEKLFNFPPLFKKLVEEGINVPIDCLLKDAKKPTDAFRYAIKNYMIKTTGMDNDTISWPPSANGAIWTTEKYFKKIIPNLCDFRIQWEEVLQLITKLKQKKTTNQDFDEQVAILELYANLRALSKGATDNFKIQIENFIKKFSDGLIKYDKLLSEIKPLIKQDLLENRLYLIGNHPDCVRRPEYFSNYYETILKSFLKNQGTYRNMQYNLEKTYDQTVHDIYNQGIDDKECFDENKIINFITANLEKYAPENDEKLYEFTKQEQDYQVTLIKVKKHIKEIIKEELEKKKKELGENKKDNGETKDNESVPEIEVLSCGFEKILL